MYLKGDEEMDIYNSLIQFFGIDTLSSTATFIDLVNFMFAVTIGVYLVAFFIRSLFLMVAIPDSSIWR